MFLKLGKTTINYSSDVNDFLIFSEVINSKTSLPRPTIVRTSDELDIWFGKTFTDRNYFDELIKSGISLYLYKPVSNNNNKYDPNYIDYENYLESEKVFLKSDEIKDPKDNIIYKIYSDKGVFKDKIVDENNEYYITYNKYLYLYNEFIDIFNLPQNLDNGNTESINNRETLRIFQDDYLGPKYVSPRYFSDTEENYDNYEINSEILLENLPDLNRVYQGYDTLSIDININYDELNLNSEITNYIVISNIQERVLVWFKGERNKIPNISPSLYDRSVYIDTINSNFEESIQNLINIFKSLGYNVLSYSNNKFTLYTSFKLDKIFLYYIPGLDISQNYRITQDILSLVSLTNKNYIEFISNTIGSSEKYGEIEVKIEKLPKNEYRVIISRFNYSEVFEGSFSSKEGRLDNVISNNSKLVTCIITNSNLKIPTGSWKLTGSVDEVYTKDMYWKSLRTILNEPIKIDYFLIPNINNYVDKIDPDYNYFKEYEEILDLSKNLGCQVLIQNSDSGWKIISVENLPENPKEGIVYKYNNRYYILNGFGNLIETTDRLITNEFENDFIFNYTEDKENILVYFYRNMTIYGNYRPGYYLFIKNLLLDNFMASEKDVIYEYPTKNPYVVNDGIEKYLINSKSNYLVTNNHYVFYKSYQNGEDYETSIWMRFCLGKISRELEKNKWNYLSKKSVGEIRRVIQELLNNIKISFSIINSISITDIEVDFKNNKITLSIETIISDIVNSNIELEVILNYNN